MIASFPITPALRENDALYDAMLIVPFSNAPAQDGRIMAYRLEVVACGVGRVSARIHSAEPVPAEMLGKVLCGSEAETLAYVYLDNAAWLNDRLLKRLVDVATSCAKPALTTRILAWADGFADRFELHRSTAGNAAASGYVLAERFAVRLADFGGRIAYGVWSTGGIMKNDEIGEISKHPAKLCEDELACVWLDNRAKLDAAMLKELSDATRGWFVARVNERICERRERFFADHPEFAAFLEGDAADATEDKGK